MARKTKEDAQKTREAILQSAIKVFSINGVSNSTLAQIAKEAGVTRGAIYWHFKNKEDMLSELWDQLLQPFEPVNHLINDTEEADPIGRLLEIYHEFFRQLKEDRQLMLIFRILFNKCESIEMTGAVQLHRVNCHKEGHEKIEQVIKNAIRHGQLPDNLDPGMGAIATIAYMDGLVNNWIMFPHLLDVEREIPVMLEGVRHMLLNGFVTEHA